MTELGGITPSIAPGTLRVALILLRREQYPEALAAFGAAIAATPDSADLYAYRSGALLSQGRAEEARDDSDRALQLDPGGFAANQKAGELSMRLGDLSTAERYFLVALRAARPGSSDELAAARLLAVVRRQQRSSISHYAVLPGKPRLARPFGRLVGRLLGLSGRTTTS